MEYETSGADRVRLGKHGRELDTAPQSGIEQLSVHDLPMPECVLAHRWTALAAVMLSVCLISRCQAQSLAPSPSEDKLPAITTALQAHGLSNMEAKRALPVHLRGVITYFDPDFGTGYAAIFIHDDSGSVFVSQTSTLAAPLFVGALVDVRGVTAPGGFGPIVTKPQISILGRASLPRTLRALLLPASRPARTTRSG